jgi:hypothetical protein
MGKPRIIVTCPVTDVAVITTIDYDEMVRPRLTPILFNCPCGETHKLRYAGRHADLHRPGHPTADQKAS